MTTVLSKATRYSAILRRDRKFDGIFYFAKKTGIYCNPSCPAKHPLQKKYSFFTSTFDAESHHYRACKRCSLDVSHGNLSSNILSGIDAGVINDKGVSGLAHSLRISERQLRRIVQSETGTSPIHLNRDARLSAAKQLVTHTTLPIIEVAFNVGFSSLRQFNSVFKNAFKLSPSEMRKGVISAPNTPQVLLPDKDAIDITS